MLPKYFWECGLPLECDRLTLRENCLSPSLAGGETSCPLSLCDGIWSDLSLHRPCACCHHCCESICADGLLYLEDAVSLWSSTRCGSYMLSAPSSAMNPDSWEEGVKKNVLFLFLFFEARPHLVEAGFEPLIFLPPPLECWDYRHVSPTSSLKFCFLFLFF